MPTDSIIPILDLTLPIILSAVAVFFASFLSWMVLGLHQHDWRKLPREDDFLRAAREAGVPPGNFMFPGCESREEMASEEHKRKWEQGPRGVMTVFASHSMARNLALTFLYFLVVNFTLAYLTTLAMPRGAAFMPVFRFASTAALLAYLSAIVGHAIWFHCRIVGHIIESIAYAAMVGAIFAALWPN